MFIRPNKEGTSPRKTTTAHGTGHLWMEDVLKEAPYVVLRNGQWQLRSSCHRFQGCSHQMQWQQKPTSFYHLYGFSWQIVESFLDFLKWDDSWNFPGALRGGRGDCRSLIGTQTDWIYEDLLWNSPKNFTPKTTLHSEFETSLDLEKKLSNLSVLCDNSNVPWLGHETLHQILPPCGGAPICPLRKGNTSPEIRLPH